MEFSSPALHYDDIKCREEVTAFYFGRNVNAQFLFIFFSIFFKIFLLYNEGLHRYMGWSLHSVSGEKKIGNLIIFESENL